MQKYVIISNFVKKTDQTSKRFNNEYYSEKFGKNYNILTKNKSTIVNLSFLH